VKINFTSIGCVPAADLERNEENARRLGFPKWKPAAVQRLAVVGGGPSINHVAGELAIWDGDIWAINGAFWWCWSRGIDAAFFTIDPQPVTSPLAVGADRAVLSVQCHPSMFDVLENADIEAFEVRLAGATTATAAPGFAIEKGYRNVTFFGCESSYEGETHAYKNDRDLKSLMRVRCDNKEFLTTPDMMMQAEFLGTLIRQTSCFNERSGGLLAAVVNDPEIDVIAATTEIHRAVS
jgi:hypothetical protein